MALHLRKRVAQVGVVSLVAANLIPLFPFLWSSIFIFLLTPLSGLILLIAALIPAPEGETWGSMWPLVGYDNAIDALYVRGPWWQRIYELDEIDAQSRLNTAMAEWF